MRSNKTKKTIQSYKNKPIPQQLMESLKNNNVIKASDLLINNTNLLSETELLEIFTWAVQNNSLSILKIIFKEQPNYCKKNLNRALDPEKENTLLHTACEQNQYDLVNFYMNQEEINPYLVNKKKEIPLMIAIDQGNTQIAKLLLKVKTPTSIPVGGKATLLALSLVHAYLKDNDVIAEEILKSGIDPNLIKFGKTSNIFLQAVNDGKIKFVKLLIKYGADVNFKQPATQPGPTITPLVTACREATPNEKGQKYLEIISLLLENNADTRNSSLHLACAHRNLIVVNLLLNAKTNPDQILRSMNNTTPLILACSKPGSLPIVETLLKISKISINVADNDGDTPLIVSTHHTEIAKLLIDNNANIHHTNKNGYDAIYYACVNSNYSLVKMLIDKNANINKLYPAINDSSQVTSLLQIAIDNEDIEIINLLINNHSSLIIEKTTPFQPLTLACEKKNLEEVVKTMLAKMTPEDIKLSFLKITVGSFTRNLTPLMTAILYRNNDLALILINNPQYGFKFEDDTLFCVPTNSTLVLKSLLIHCCGSNDKPIELTEKAKSCLNLMFITAINSKNFEVTTFLLNYNGKIKEYLLSNVSLNFITMNKLMTSACTPYSLGLFNLIIDEFEKLSLEEKDKTITYYFSDEKIEESPLTLAISSGNIEYFIAYYEKRNLSDEASKHFLRVAIAYRQQGIIDFIKTKLATQANIKPDILQLEKVSADALFKAVEKLDNDESKDDESKNKKEIASPPIPSSLGFFDEANKAIEMMKQLSLDKEKYKALLKKIEEEQRKSIRQEVVKPLTKRQWGNGTIDDSQVKSFEKGKNLFLLVPPYIQDELRKNKKQQEFNACLSYPKKAPKKGGPGFKPLEGVKHIKIKLGNKIEECAVWEGKQMHNGARLICIAFPSDSTKEGQQGTLLIPFYYDASGLHSNEDVKELNTMLGAKSELEYAYDLTPSIKQQANPVLQKKDHPST